MREPRDARRSAGQARNGPSASFATTRRQSAQQRHQRRAEQQQRRHHHHQQQVLHHVHLEQQAGEGVERRRDGDEQSVARPARKLASRQTGKRSGICRVQHAPAARVDQRRARAAPQHEPGLERPSEASDRAQPASPSRVLAQRARGGRAAGCAASRAGSWPGGCMRLQERDERRHLGRAQVLAVGRHVAAALQDLADRAGRASGASRRRRAPGRAARPARRARGSCGTACPAPAARPAARAASAPSRRRPASARRSTPPCAATTATTGAEPGERAERQEDQR